MASCPRTLWLTWRSVCDLSRAGGRPETYALQVTKCLWTFCWWTITLLTKWLCRFSMEACKLDGESYPSKTLQQYLMAIQRHIQKQKENQINPMTHKEFIVLRNLLDSLYRRLHAQGVGCNSKPTEALTQEDEVKLWDSGVLNQNISQGLLSCMFFLNAKNFCLCGGSEHHELKLSQFCREVVKVDGQSMVQYTYSEHGSRNRSGRLKLLWTANNVVHQYDSDRIYRQVPCPYTRHLHLQNPKWSKRGRCILSQTQDNYPRESQCTMVTAPLPVPLMYEFIL